MNGTFGFGRNDGPFDAGNPFTYPDLLTIRVGGESRFYEKAHYVSGFAQDKWRLNNRLTLSLGLRYDLEVIPIPETDDPITGEGNYPVDKNNIQPRVGFSYDLGGRGQRVIRGGYGRFYDKTHFELIGGLFTGTPFTSSFTRTFPLTGADPEPAPGAVADRSDAGQRADAQSGAARHAVPARHAAAQHRRQLGQPGSRGAAHRSVDRSATSISSGARHVGQRRLRPRARAATC